MPRFFVPDEQFNASLNQVTLVGEDAHHIARSLRMAVGDFVTVCSLTGQAFSCRLCSIHDEEVVADVVSPILKDGEMPVELHLYFGYPKGDKLETIVQKAVELGAHTITPFDSEYCIKRPDPEKAKSRLPRWNKIACEAAKQCGRSRLPEVFAPLSFGEMLEKAGESGLVLFCYEAEGALSLKQVLTHLGGVSSVSVIVGAEGGFSPKEAAAAAKRGYHLVNLGPRILRCETAPLYALAALSYFYEL